MQTPFSAFACQPRRINTQAACVCRRIAAETGGGYSSEMNEMEQVDGWSTGPRVRAHNASVCVFARAPVSMRLDVKLRYGEMRVHTRRRVRFCIGRQKNAHLVEFPPRTCYRKKNQ